jgi:hypothetical protein
MPTMVILIGNETFHMATMVFHILPRKKPETKNEQQTNTWFLKIYITIHHLQLLHYVGLVLL